MNMLKPRLDYLKDRHLRLLVFLAEERQLGKAAARLGISQPAASKTLIEIEERTASTLFVRGPHETLPTEQGKILIGYARHCLGETKRVTDELEAMSTRKTRTLRIGMLASAALTVVPRAVAEFLRIHPQVEISLEESVLPQLVEKLRGSEIDLFVGRIESRVPRNEFEEIFLFDEPLNIVCRRGHPILAPRPVALADTLSYPWILPLRTTLMREKLNQIFRTHKLDNPSLVVESNSQVANIAILQDSDRLAAMSHGAAQNWAEQGVLAIVPIDISIHPGSIGVVLRRNESHLPAIEQFVQVLRSLHVPAM